MNAHNIKIALRYVHMHELCSTNPNGVTRVEAYRAAIPALSNEERAVLRNALHIQDDEAMSDQNEACNCDQALALSEALERLADAVRAACEQGTENALARLHAAEAEAREVLREHGS